MHKVTNVNLGRIPVSGLEATSWNSEVELSVFNALCLPRGIDTVKENHMVTVAFWICLTAS